MLRSLLIVNLLLVAAAAIRSPSVGGIWLEFLVFAAFGEPVLMLSLVALCAARRWLHAMGYVGALAALAAFEILVGWFVYGAAGALVPERSPMPFGQVMFLVFFVTAVTLAYFDLRTRALSPAIAEARIQALQARIRPHFLYNSINAVLSLIRSEPRRAERALGLKVTWRIETMPADALVPPLVLQPLVENAVYHGIEPSEAGGEIEIDIARAGGQLAMVLKNPFPGGGRHSSGNRMAIVNIRERLQLHFDVEASMRSEVKEGTYTVTIRIPYITQPG